MLGECQPVRRGDGATTAGEQRMGPRRSGGWAKNFFSRGLEVEQIFAGRFLSAPLMLNAAASGEEHDLNVVDFWSNPSERPLG